MSYLAILGSVMAVHLAAVVSPGPNFLVVAQTSVGASRYSGLAAALGVALAAPLWAAAALFGVSVLFEAAPWFYGLLKLLGGAYLVYLGVGSWRRAREPLVAGGDATGRAPSGWRAFRLGFLTNLTNPKSAVFFGSIFSVLLPPELPLGVRVAAVGVVFANASCWYLVVATLFSAGRVQRLYVGAKRHIDRAVGGFFALLGLGLMFSSR